MAVPRKRGCHFHAWMGEDADNGAGAGGLLPSFLVWIANSKPPNYDSDEAYFQGA